MNPHHHRIEQLLLIAPESIQIAARSNFFARPPNLVNQFRKLIRTVQNDVMLLKDASNRGLPYRKTE
jgi:hypothetical protein